MKTVLKNNLKTAYLRIRRTLLCPLLNFRTTQKPRDGEIKKILFLRHDRIGDMIQSTAVLKALKRMYPAARLTVLASERNHELIQNNPNVDEVIIYRGIFRFIKEMRLRNFDLAIDPFNTYELKQAFMTYISRAKYRIGFEEAGREIFLNVKGPELLPVRNFVDHMLELVSCLGGDTNGCAPELFLTEEEKAWARRSLESRGIGEKQLIVAIHPGAYYESQRWLPGRFAEIAKRLISECGTKVFFFEYSREEPLPGTTQGMAKNYPGIEIFSGLQLRQFVALLSHCGLLVCNNSGPLHIAAALRIPTVSIIGPTVIPLWLPYGNNHIVIRKDLPCSPCNKAECKPRDCMELIGVDEVWAAVKSQISKLSQGK